MGSAIAALLRGMGNEVVWASAGRSPDTARRAASADLTDVGSVADLARASSVVLSVCPPHAALDVAEAATGFSGLYVDANAVSPATARAVGERVERHGATFVDGSIIGLPPRSAGTTRLYLSGPKAQTVADLFSGTNLSTIVLDGPPGAASALKAAYAGWTKGSLALLLAIRASARAEGVENALLAEWGVSIPGLIDRSRQAARPAAAKGWRWIGEMEEIAATLASSSLPTGFHEAAAEVFRRASDLDGEAADEDALLDLVLAALLRRATIAT